ncbi:hypothetical protein L484_006243 [Morus notabilis]|uniref:E3 ubiquitin-protein ligase LIN-1 n=1 Tax=Morus notabilis TaxID=981085 RepID=W9QZ74_9ROSA|nr:hypothetical protein L484_006243 [Morus notabilis]
MSSLSELLAKEGFEGERSLQARRNLLKHRDKVAPDRDSIALPLYICHANNGRKNRCSSKQRIEKPLTVNGSSVFSSKRVGSVSERSNSKSSVSEFSRREDPAIDEVSVRAVVSILSGYVGRFIKDENFRENVREKCVSCLARGKTDLDDEIFERLEISIQSVDKLLEEKGVNKERIVENVIQILSAAASTNAKKGNDPYISACAQLYLSIVHKIERNDGKCTTHLLQVFCDSPFLARTHLVPDLWEHFFLPHLLHLKVWYTNELEFLTDLECREKEKKMKTLSKVYNKQMDKGTVEFALYYKKWLKVGVENAPVVPLIPLPVRPYRASRRSMDTCSTHSSVNNNLYRVVFGSKLGRKSENFADQSPALRDMRDVNEEEILDEDKDDNNNGSFLHREQRSSSLFERNWKSELWRDTQKSENFRLFTCQQTAPLQLECLTSGNHLSKNSSVRKKEETRNVSSNLSRAIASVCSSDSLSECEVAIRTITRAWLDSRGDPIIEDALSKAPVIEGMLEVLFASEDDEILELVISILAELVSRSDLNRLIVLNFDPQLDIFMRHLRSTSLFLKAAVLLYLSRPKAKQMVSVEWVPLVLRVTEFGDQLQTLFTVQCSPLVAAFYLLDQILTGFDEDRNLDNARQVVSLGGLSMLTDKIKIGDTTERINAAMFISCCIRADGSCRNYLAENLSIDSLIELVLLEYHRNPCGSAFDLLIELICLSRRTQINKILYILKEGWGSLNIMHILLAYLRKAPSEKRPLVAAILLQLDLLEDPSKCSIYREDAVEAIIEALDCQIYNENVQEQSARALLMLGGRFSYTGDATIENWLLEQAGFNEFGINSYNRTEFLKFQFSNDELVAAVFVHDQRADEEAAENWQKKAAAVLFKSGNKRLLDALSVSISNGISSLSRASLITVSWMCTFLHLVGDENLQLMACSILVPQFVASLSYDKDVEGKVLASYSLLNLTKHSAECVSMLLSLDKDHLLSHLKQLRLVTWTADELLSIIMNRVQGLM